jgi:thioredoxin-like negative regulator of GroEL
VVDALRPEFRGEVAFVMANLNTREGREFAARHRVPNTTLVFLDANGRRLAILQGTQKEAALRWQIRSIFGLHASTG